MAARTLFAELAGMNIITAMTGYTVPIQPGLVVTPLGVTGLAGQFTMSSIEQEAGAGIMIELPQFPVVRIVTGAAIFSEAVFMRIVLSVTIKTGSFGIGKPGRQVACLTRGYRM